MNKPKKNILEEKYPYKEPMTEIEERTQEGRNKGLTQGLCIAIAHLLREGYCAVAKDIWRGAGMTIEECLLLEVDEYDLKVIKKNKKEL